MNTDYATAALLPEAGQCVRAQHRLGYFASVHL